MKTGELKLNSTGRWEIAYEDDQSDELTSGDICEVKIAGNWIKTGIEATDGKYYATCRGILLTSRLPARLVEQ